MYIRIVHRFRTFDFFSEVVTYIQTFAVYHLSYRVKIVFDLKAVIGIACDCNIQKTVVLDYYVSIIFLALFDPFLSFAFFQKLSKEGH